MKGYSQFCPVAKGAEVFNERWTPLIIRELMCGSHRFNELKHGNPLMSPSLLSNRLKSLEEAGVVKKIIASAGNSAEYHLTPAGEDLGQLVVRLGLWGMKWARSHLTEGDYDPELLMWDVRRRIDVSEFPNTRQIIGFVFLDMPLKKRSWWLIVDKGEVDLCRKDPGYEVDLVFKTTAKTMAGVWMGYTTVKKEIKNKTLSITGSVGLKDRLDDWLIYSVFTRPETMLKE